MLEHMAKIEGAVARLGQAVEARRRYLGLSQIDVWQAGGPSNSTLTRIENGEGDAPSAATLRKLDTALEWGAGTSAAILAGIDPDRVYRAGAAFDQIESLRVHSQINASPSSSLSGSARGRPAMNNRRNRQIEQRAVPERLGLALALAAEDAGAAADYFDSITWDESDPGSFDFDDLEIAQYDVVTSIDKLTALATAVAERILGGRANLELAKQQDRARRGEIQPELEGFEEVQELAAADRKHAALPENEKQTDYDLAGGWAARTVPGPTDAEKRHAAQDSAAEAPDEDGPDAGA